jgi:hypothetical protein
VSGDHGPFANLLQDVIEQARSIYEAERDRVADTSDEDLA